ncbi:hypothetical protein [Streptomyces sp. NBC_01363]|uniref:hypothetical protein n=1 Tax=Streptomyces sp. NBC_01363 TaxID=2903840 RepID=UPI00224FDA50|nr:hypothetical protein [Streptomyces sp. NBC_01363]MCX4736662.1 hypothetical protein [Streptomyces sp. NBC_01363]
MDFKIRDDRGPEAGEAFLRDPLYSLPGAAVALKDPGARLALAVGVLPVALMGLPARRRARRATVVVGLCTGLRMVLGSLLVQVRWVAVPRVFVLTVAAAALVRSGGETLQTAPPRIAEFGPAAVMAVNSTDDRPANTGCPVPFPAFSVPRSLGDRVAAAAARGRSTCG